MSTPRTVLACVLAASGLWLTCSGPDVAGNGSQTGNPAVLGYIYTENGAPAAGAIVRLAPAQQMPWPALARAAAVSFSAVTDERGAYGFDSLPAGYYCVLGEDGGNLSFQDSVLVRSDTATRIPADTLRQPGSLTGMLRLQNNGDCRTVLVLVFGEGSFAFADAAGTFTLANMAEGVYRVRFLSTLDAYLPLDTQLTIAAGRSDTLADTVVLRTRGVQPPQGLLASYDTAQGVVRLVWRPARDCAPVGYLPYRNLVSESVPRVLGGGRPWADTVFLDTVYRSSTDTSSYLYEYRVRTVDSASALSDYSGVALMSVVPPCAVLNAVELSPAAGVAAAVGDTVTIVATFRNPTRYITSLAWYVDGSGAPVRERTLLLAQGSDTLRWAWDSAGMGRVRLVVRDDGGGSAWDSASVAVSAWRPCAPLAQARLGPCAATVSGRVYVFGGSSWRFGAALTSVEVYDTAANQWSTCRSMPTARSYAAAAAVGGRVYLIGGKHSDGTAAAEVEEYDPVADTWAAKAPMPTARHSLACAVIGGRVYALGGVQTGVTALTTVEEYDPPGNAWRGRAPMAVPRERLLAAAFDATVIAIGGRNAPGASPSESGVTVERYDTAQDAWQSAPAAPLNLYDGAAVVLDSLVFAVGGYESDGFVSHNARTGVWRVVGPIVPKLWSNAAAAVGGRIYAIGGSDDQGMAVARVEVYQP